MIANLKKTFLSLAATFRTVLATLRGRDEKEYSDAAMEFATHARLFAGLYEPLNLIAQGKLPHPHDVFADWDVRVSNLDEAETLRALWEERYSGFDSWSNKDFTKKGKELMALVGKSGVFRGADSEITVERGSFKYYSPQDGGVIPPGSKAIVVTPYWGMGNDVLEKGHIRGVETGREDRGG